MNSFDPLSFLDRGQERVRSSGGMQYRAPGIPNRPRNGTPFPRDGIDQTTSSLSRTDSRQEIIAPSFQPPELKFLNGDEEFRKEGLPANLEKQIHEHCQKFKTNVPSCSRYIDKSNTGPNFKESKAAPFVVPGTNEVLLTAHFAFSNRKILVARQRFGNSWMDGQAAILVHHNQKRGKRTKWFVWNPTWPEDRWDPNADYAERAVDTPFTVKDGRMVWNGEVENERDTNSINILTDEDYQDGASRHRTGAGHQIQPAMKRSSSFDYGLATDFKPRKCRRLTGYSEAEYYGRIWDSDEDEAACHDLPDIVHETAPNDVPGSGSNTILALGAGTVSNSGLDAVHRRDSESATQTANHTSSTRVEQSGTMTIAPPTIDPNIQKRNQNNQVNVLNATFTFISKSPNHQPQKEPFADCDTVKKLFIQALCRGTATPDTWALQVRLNGETPAYKIFRNNERDFEKLTQALHTKARDGKTIEAVVEVLDFC